MPGMANVFGVGDTVASNAWNGQPVPGLAPAAKQGGAYVAKQIRALIDARAPVAGVSLSTPRLPAEVQFEVARNAVTDAADLGAASPAAT